MKKRPVKLQERMGQLMADRGMQMGVLVAHTIAWSEPNLASGDPVMRGRFLDEIRESVEVAQRVGSGPKGRGYLDDGSAGAHGPQNVPGLPDLPCDRKPETGE
jgi:hypothetical protein